MTVFTQFASAFIEPRLCYRSLLIRLWHNHPAHITNQPSGLVTVWVALESIVRMIIIPK